MYVCGFSLHIYSLLQEDSLTNEELRKCLIKENVYSDQFVKTSLRLLWLEAYFCSHSLNGNNGLYEHTFNCESNKIPLWFALCLMFLFS